MAEFTLTEVVDAIVGVCNEATERGERLRRDKIEAAILARWPNASAILQLAFDRAVARLREEAERNLRAGEALETLQSELDKIMRETGLSVAGETPVIDFLAAAAATGNERALRLLERLRSVGQRC